MPLSKKLTAKLNIFIIFNKNKKHGLRKRI